MPEKTVEELIDLADRTAPTGMDYVIAVCLANLVGRLDTIANTLQAGNVVQAIAHDVDARLASGG